MHYVKLEETPRERLRVHEVAKRVDRPCAEILALLTDLGEYAPHRNSMLEPPVVRRIYQALGLTPPQRPAPQSPNVSTPPPTGGLTPPRPRARRDNHPLMGTISSRQRNESPQSAPRDSPAASRFRNIADSLAQAYGSDVAAGWEYESWKLLGFTEVERDAWTAEGLRTGQAPVAATLRDAGLSPADLSVRVNGWTVLARLTKGEGAAQVVRLLKGQRGQSAG